MGNFDTYFTKISKSNFTQKKNTFSWKFLYTFPSNSTKVEMKHLKIKTRNKQSKETEKINCRYA